MALIRYAWEKKWAAESRYSLNSSKSWQTQQPLLISPSSNHHDKPVNMTVKNKKMALKWHESFTIFQKLPHRSRINSFVWRVCSNKWRPRQDLQISCPASYKLPEIREAGSSDTYWDILFLPAADTSLALKNSARPQREQVTAQVTDGAA